jgi:hypothetical protein
VIKISLNTFSSGVNTSFSTELNENFKIALKVLAEDDTSSSTTANSRTKISPTVSIPANAVNDHIIILLNGGGGFNAGASGTAYGEVTVDVGETGSLSTVHTWVPIQGLAGDTDQLNIRGQRFIYYTPSSDEKTNGFDIEIYGEEKLTGSGVSGTGSAYYDSMTVLGG